MTPDENTRIEFAERQGWTRIERGIVGNISGKSLLNARSDWKGTPPEDGGKDEDDQEFKVIPNPTDRNHVHTALMGMSEEEWSLFGNFIWLEVKANSHHPVSVVTEVLKTPLSTLVSCYLEATKERTKQ